ncbi:MAG: hypothetical protein DRJ52_04325 [Thermoprotei archaeon]|nr:MAG: hypothetical protein DRJ52_04325 [Thermoprotei archaeon]RLE99178.1 MAG: hypothetical protein DRJ63_06115 [Thermoprotei archaeon]HDI74633.1 hypothetical protein [Thermoprotei archaeon]
MKLLGVALLDKNDLPILVRTYKEDLNIDDISNMISVACTFLSKSSTESSRRAFMSIGGTSIYYFKTVKRGCIVIGEKVEQDTLSKVAKVLVEIEIEKIETPLEEVMYAIDRIVAATFGEENFIKQFLGEETLQEYRLVFVSDDYVSSLNFNIDDKLSREVRRLIKQSKKNITSEKTSSGEDIVLVRLGSRKTLCLIGQKLDEKTREKIERLVNIFQIDAPSVLLTGQYKKMYDSVRASYELLVDNGKDFMLYEIYNMLSQGLTLKQIVKKMYREHYMETL